MSKLFKKVKKAKLKYAVGWRKDSKETGNSPEEWAKTAQDNCIGKYEGLYETDADGGAYAMLYKVDEDDFYEWFNHQDDLYIERVIDGIHYLYGVIHHNEK